MKYKIQPRREKALDYLEKQLEAYKKDEAKENRRALRMILEVSILKDRLANKKKLKVNKQGMLVAEKDRYFIDIYQINLAYVKNSERRKNKGKSKKTLKRQRSVTFIKSVVAQPGMMQKYRDGLMGVSPKNHSFRFRKDEPSYN